MTRYTKRFYDRRETRIIRSADALVPLVTSLLQPRSVIDIGCANGIWLDAFQRHGVKHVIGIDGPWVPRDRLLIDEDRFVTCDLGKAPLPYHLELPRKRYDMLLSLELLEHLVDDRADAMVDLMCSLSDVLIVSAAVPHQGGTGHVNEQWPDHWVSRFASRGYLACDFLRFACWTDDRIAPWYRQNVIGYFRGDVPEQIGAFAKRSLERMIEHPLPLCHPGVFSYKLGKLRSWIRNPLAMGLRELRRRTARQTVKR